jgi:hypothetical protein
VLDLYENCWFCLSSKRARLQHKHKLNSHPRTATAVHSKTVQQFTLTHSMEQSPSWEANRSSATQEIPRILCNSNLHYRIHKGPTPVINLNQIDPVHTPPHPTDRRYILILSSHLRRNSSHIKPFQPQNNKFVIQTSLQINNLGTVTSSLARSEPVHFFLLWGGGGGCGHGKE